MFKNFIWDFDGTLYDTYPVMLDSIIQSLKQDFELNGDRKRIYYLLKSESSKAVAQEYGLDFDLFTTAFKKIENQDPRQSLPFAGTIEVLETIRNQHGRNFILTHRMLKSTETMLVQDGFHDLITEIVGSDQDFPRKPDPTSLNYFLNKYGMDPNETVMVGDRKLDIEAGKNAGVATIFFDVEALLDDMQADYRVFSMNDILKILQR